VVMSLLRPAFGQGARALLLRGSMNACKNQLALPAVYTGAVRQMGGHNRIQIIPSRFEWDRWKDNMHFYLFLGFFPMGLLIMYCNLFIGQATLADIPDDYEPMPWEYYKGPIERWFAKNVYDYEEKRYEITLHNLWEEGEKRKIRQLQKKVKKLMNERQDYKAWYYVPIDKSRIDDAREAQRKWKEDYTGSGPA